MEENHQITLTEWMEMKEAIRKELNNVKHAFVRVGYYLRRAEDEKLYLNDGYSSLAEFAQKEYGLGATAVSRFMSINRRYSVDGYSAQLLPEYSDYKQSVLTEMLALPDQDLQMVTPDTPREAVRELNRFNRQDPGETDEGLSSMIRSFFGENMDLAAQTGGWEDLQEKELAELLNPGGSRTYRKGLYFMSMTEGSVNIKKFGQAPQAMSYREFLQEAAGILDDLRKEIDDGKKEWPKVQEPEEPEDEEEGEPGPAEEGEGIGTDGEGTEKNVVGDDEPDRGTEQEPGIDKSDAGGTDPDDGQDGESPEEPGTGDKEGENTFVPAQIGRMEELPEPGTETDGEPSDAREKTFDYMNPPGTDGAISVRTDQESFTGLQEGKRKFLLRKMDRSYRPGDILTIQEFDDSRFTGRSTRAEVTAVVHGSLGLRDGYCILGLK